MKKYYLLAAVFLIIIGISIFVYSNIPKWECEAEGGKWYRIGLDLKKSCNLPTSDAGKECSDSDECEGHCIAELSKEDWDRAEQGVVYTKGKCTAWKITVGCDPYVEDGKVHGILCVD